MRNLRNQDPEVAQAISSEQRRQKEGLELIPSENYVSGAVHEANASVFTNKYSEGYPGKRYYGGQEFTDRVETLAIERAKALFGADFVNVQPLSGAPANLAAYFALAQPASTDHPADTILGMELSHGGHLTHGAPVTVPPKLFNFVRYGMKNPDTGEIDYEELRETALREKPKILLAGFSSYPRELDYEKFVSIAHEVGAYTIMDASHIAGLIAGGALKNPFEAGFDVMTTTTHKTLRGPRGGMILTRDNEKLAKKIDKTVFPGLQGGPHMHTIAAKAVAFGEAQQSAFSNYAKQIITNARAMAEVFGGQGIRMISGGTDNHLLLLDVHGSRGITGKEAQSALDEVGITVNMNIIADDPRKPLDPSGIRLGTPALTTRGFQEEDCRQVAELIVEAIDNTGDEQKKKAILEKVTQLADAHPIPELFV